MTTNLYPTSSVSSVVLPETASYTDVNTVTHPLPFGVYSSDEFKRGAASQVAFTFQRMGGNTLDLEIDKYSVFAAYEESCLEYSYLVNLYQARSTLGSALGGATASFDHMGEVTGSGGAPASSSLKYIKYNFGYLNSMSKMFSEMVGIGGYKTVYSASIDIVAGQQDYDLQAILEASADFSGTVGDKRVFIKKIHYQTGMANWSLYGIYGGLNTVAGFMSYNNYSSETSFEIMPSWEMKLRVMSLEDRLWNRTSHYSYEIRNNKVRLFPIPTTSSPTKMWFEFIVPEDNAPWASADSATQKEIDGVNNINTMPFANIPYENINSMGKMWIRNYALALSKETLGYVRSKMSAIPIPGDSITLNGEALLSAAQQEKEKLKEELLKVLEETDYAALSEKDSKAHDDLQNSLSKVPTLIFMG